jgi:hypothetical protein
MFVLTPIRAVTRNNVVVFLGGIYDFQAANRKEGSFAPSSRWFRPVAEKEQDCPRHLSSPYGIPISGEGVVPGTGRGWDRSSAEYTKTLPRTGDHAKYTETPQKVVLIQQLTETTFFYKTINKVYSKTFCEE